MKKILWLTIFTFLCLIVYTSLAQKETMRSEASDLPYWVSQIRLIWQTNKDKDVSSKILEVINVGISENDYLKNILKSWDKNTIAIKLNYKDETFLEVSFKIKKDRIERIFLGTLADANVKVEADVSAFEREIRELIKMQLKGGSPGIGFGVRTGLKSIFLLARGKIKVSPWTAIFKVFDTFKLLQSAPIISAPIVPPSKVIKPVTEIGIEKNTTKTALLAKEMESDVNVLSVKCEGKKVEISVQNLGKPIPLGKAALILYSDEIVFDTAIESLDGIATNDIKNLTFSFEKELTEEEYSFKFVLPGGIQQTGSCKVGKILERGKEEIIEIPEIVRCAPVFIRIEEVSATRVIASNPSAQDITGVKLALDGTEIIPTDTTLSAREVKTYDIALGTNTSVVARGLCLGKVIVEGRCSEGDVCWRAPILVKCPSDYCGKRIYGMGPCPGWTGTKPCTTDADCSPDERCDPGYKKCVGWRIYWQGCWDYPERAESLADCEAKKTWYRATCGVGEKSARCASVFIRIEEVQANRVIVSNPSREDITNVRLYLDETEIIPADTNLPAGAVRVYNIDLGTNTSVVARGLCLGEVSVEGRCNKGDVCWRVAERCSHADFAIFASFYNARDKTLTSLIENKAEPRLLLTEINILLRNGSIDVRRINKTLPVAGGILALKFTNVEDCSSYKILTECRDPPVFAEGIC